jgi:hypothetical protein
VRNWNVDLEHAADCGQTTGYSETIPLDDYRSNWAMKCYFTSPITQLPGVKDPHLPGLDGPCKKSKVQSF